MRASLIIPAAGRGQRFGSAVPKQLLPLCGRLVLLHSLHAFAGMVTEAVVAVDADSRDRVRAAIDSDRPPFPVHLVAGDATRQASVHAALSASAADSAAVLVHDAVRPLIPRSCIAACIHALERHAAAVVAVPCSATVKRAATAPAGGDDVALVLETVPREALWLAQTPQGFHRSAGLIAFARATQEGWVCSDDAQVLERAGITVALVPGDARNLKITTRDDWAIAEALMHLALRESGSAPA